MPKLGFGQIDTKVSGVYNPIELWLSEGEEGKDYGSPLNLNNKKVIMYATAEYLNALLSLQKQIREKYEPQLTSNVEVNGEPGLNSIDSSLAEEEEKLYNCGAKNLYYT